MCEGEKNGGGREAGAGGGVSGKRRTMHQDGHKRSDCKELLGTPSAGHERCPLFLD